jgi:hypothetical protein
MLAQNFEGAREIGKPKGMTDEECGGLPIFQLHSPKAEEAPQFVMAGVVEGPPYPFTLTHWKPSKEDLEAMNAGRGFWVRFLTHTVYPMAVFTLNEAGEINQ